LDYEDDSRYINRLANQAMPVALTREALRMATSADPKLKALTKLIQRCKVDSGKEELVREFSHMVKRSL
jgi:hypothetical protein